jgi:RNA recognition motif. (a.k.a. RRM, RBD, or RNP domain)
MPRTILVRGFDRDTTEREIRSLFSAPSDVISLRLAGARGQALQGRCFVRMRDTVAAERAVHELDGRECNGRILSIDIIGLQRTERAIDVPAPRNLFRPMSPQAWDADTPADLGELALSFVVGGRAFGHLAENLQALQPQTRVAVEAASNRGGIASMYYFIDVADEVARDMRNSLRVRSRRKDHDGRACDAAASAIEARRRCTWHLTPCPRCGGHLAPKSWLTPAIFTLECAACHWTIPG